MRDNSLKRIVLVLFVLIAIPLIALFAFKVKHDNHKSAEMKDYVNGDDECAMWIDAPPYNSTGRCITKGELRKNHAERIASLECKGDIVDFSNYSNNSFSFELENGQNYLSFGAVLCLKTSTNGHINGELKNELKESLIKSLGKYTAEDLLSGYKNGTNQNSEEDWSLMRENHDNYILNKLGKDNKNISGIRIDEFLVQ